MKKLGVFLLRHGLDISISQGYPAPLNLSVHIYTPVWRGTVRVKCLGQEHTTVARSGLEPGTVDLESSAQPFVHWVAPVTFHRSNNKCLPTCRMTSKFPWLASSFRYGSDWPSVPISPYIAIRGLQLSPLLRVLKVYTSLQWLPPPQR